MGLAIALATAAGALEIDFDMAPLLAALEARGHRAQALRWDQPGTDWAGWDAVLLRSTWDYHLRRAEFLAWCREVAGRTRLYNSEALVAWNSHKFYLRELSERGVPIAPTAFLQHGTSADLRALLEARGWIQAVIKPAVSADSFATIKAELNSPGEGQRHLDEHLGERDMLVQAYLPTVAEPGERCLVMIEGQFSHAVRKRSLFLGGRHAGPEGLPVEAQADEVELAGRVLGHVDPQSGPPPLYARVDLLRDPDGRLLLMEVELVEPSLFFDQGPGSVERLAEALERRVAGEPRG